MCFNASKPLVRLACGHGVCHTCATEASRNGFAFCFICRTPHVLDPKILREAASTFRSKYGAWRAGYAKGSVGEVSDLTSPSSKAVSRPSALGLHVSSAGDLAVLDSDSRHEEAVDKIGFAIVGLGRAGKIHLGVLHEREDVAVHWLVDEAPVDQVCLDKAASAQATSELHHALADPKVRCVIVSTPTPSHGVVIRAALEAGKHVFAEKPRAPIPTPPNKCDSTRSN